MKKFLVFLLPLFFLANANAQLFVGGNFSFNTKNGANKTGTVSVDKPIYADFNIGPMIGYYVNDDLALGFQFNLGGSGHTTGSGNQQNGATYSNISFEPFIRYHFIKTGNLSVMAQAYCGFGYSTVTNTAAGVTTDGPSTISFGFGVRPGASYELTDNIAIEAFFGNIGFSRDREKTSSSGVDLIETTNRLGFNLYSDFSLGFVYKFK